MLRGRRCAARGNWGKDMTDKVSRRGFFKCMGIAGGAAAVAPLLPKENLSVVKDHVEYHQDLRGIETMISATASFMTSSYDIYSDAILEVKKSWKV